MPHDSQELQTAAAVVHALGGLVAVSALTGAAYKLVSGWQSAGSFPPKYFLVMTWALHRRGQTAKPELWKQVTPRARHAALKALIADQQQKVEAA